MKRLIILWYLGFNLVATWLLAQQAPISQINYLYTMIGDSASPVRLKQARAVSVALSGLIYVSDTGNHRILKLSPDGEVLQIVGGFGWQKDQFYLPYDIHASSALDIFVADYNNHRIQRYDKDLNYISSLYSNANWASTVQFGFPKSIASSFHGELFLIDGENTRILKLNSFGEPEMSFGDFAEGRGRLLQPVKLCIGANDQIFVSDAAANKIFVFDYFGNYLMEIGGAVLSQPQGIYFSHRRLLFVADQGNRRIVVFKPDGELVLTYPGTIGASGSLQQPVDVVTVQQRLLVLDNDRLLVFEWK
ncbi:MAG: NHL repeat-containing protein [candidate division KSB1 bacterium]|nr:NHL repeat-containing protein [candidate division KSB1 bacterium]MDZ7318226.1 NHL repeat-containing protein [candidate division KSB1 bacterium]MDZ7341172.1 NHL repeat-containing protein [candidate division KSB1 bacterium]